MNMLGFGLVRDLVSTSKNNRRLLKGDEHSGYKNFDKSYITDSIISRKVPVYKDASPEYLELLKQKMTQENKRRNSILTKTFMAIFLFLSLLAIFLIF